MAGINQGVLSTLLQSKIVQKHNALFSDRTIVLSKLFEDGINTEHGEGAQYGSSEIKWLAEFGRSIAGGARFSTERMPSEIRTIGTATEYRHELGLGWLSESYAWYFAQVYVDLAVNDAGPLAQGAKKEAMTAYRMQRKAAEAVIRKMMSWHLFGPASNALAVVNVAAAVAATSFVARRNNVVANEGHRGAYPLGRNVVFTVVDPATGTPRAAAGYRVTSVVPAAAGDTVNFTPGIVAGGAFVAGDHVVEGDANSHSYGRGIVSLPALVGNALDTEIIHGQSRVLHPQLAATVLFNAGAVAFRGASLDLFERTLMVMQARADFEDTPYVLVMPPGMAADMLFAGFRVANAIAINAGEQPAQEMVRYAPTADLTYGFPMYKISVPSAPGGGVLRILVDPDCTPNRFFALKTKDFAKWVLKAAGWGPGTIMENEGHRIENFYRGFATFSAACAFTCHNIPAQVSGRQIGHNNILVAQGGEGAAATII